MAKFCTACGSPVEENQRFCLKCGAQVGTAPVSPQATPAAPAGELAMPAPPAGKKGSPVVKIILIVLGLFVAIGILAAGAGIYVVYKAKQKVASIVESARTAGGPGTPEIHLESKGGEGSEAAAAATVDVPPYPGSTATEAGGDFSFGVKGGISSQEYETSDSMEQVLTFYKDKFGSRIRVRQSDGGTMFTVSTASGLSTVTITRNEESDTTKIAITRIGKK